MRCNIGKKKLYAGLFASLAICGAAFATTDTFAAEPYQDAGFEDKELYACVVRQFNASFPGEITMTNNVYDTVLTDAQLKKMNALWCDYDHDGTNRNTYYTAPAPATSLNGLERLTGLVELHAGKHNYGKSETNWQLDLSNSIQLKYIGLFNNYLTGLVLPKSHTLERLNIGGNRLTTIDLSQQDKLKWVEIAWNRLTELNLADCTELMRLSASYNSLTSIDVSHNKKLEGLGVVGNVIYRIDVSNQPNMDELFAHRDATIIPYPDYSVNERCELTLKLGFIGYYNTITRTGDFAFNDETRELTLWNLPETSYVRVYEKISAYEGSSANYRLYLGDTLATAFNKTKGCVPKGPEPTPEQPEESDIKVPDTGGSVTGEQNAHIIEISLVALGVVAALGFIGNYIRNRLQHRVKF